MIRKLFHFLGSVYFAIFLIFLTVIFVIIGTFLESWKDSHQFAARFTYHNPFFIMLLIFYFINILFAALNRFPFRKKHIPFLITHLGLLMVISGVIFKNLFGLQGAVGLVEGGSTRRLLLLNTYALQIDSRQEKISLPLKRGYKGPLLTTPDLELTLLDWKDHSEEKIEGFIKGDFVHLMGYPPIPFSENRPFETPHYKIFAGRSESQKISFPGYAALFFLQNKEKETLIAFNEEGERFEKTLGDLYLIFDKGFGGYGQVVELPFHFPKMELMAPLTRLNKLDSTEKKLEKRTPHIRLLASDGIRSEVVSFTYDPFAEKFKWPILNGKYLVRFQPKALPLPFSIRLKEAKEVVYPHTEKPFSFESEIWVDEKEATISMNHVLEKKGYRLYMANLVKPPFGAKRAQIVINYDPVKYWLTFPGGIILAIGMLLLYLRKLYE